MRLSSEGNQVYPLTRATFHHSAAVFAVRAVVEDLRCGRIFGRPIKVSKEEAENEMEILNRVSSGFSKTVVDPGRASRLTRDDETKQGSFCRSTNVRYEQLRGGCNGV